MAELPAGMVPRLLTREQAAEYLGHVALSTLAQVPVQPVRIGRRLFYDRHALDEWLDAKRGAKAASEPNWEERALRAVHGRRS